MVAGTAPLSVPQRLPAKACAPSGVLMEYNGYKWHLSKFTLTSCYQSLECISSCPHVNRFSNLVTSMKYYQMEFCSIFAAFAMPSFGYLR
jgi:hypothetical protein